MLSFRHITQTSKSVADTTFKLPNHCDKYNLENVMYYDSTFSSTYNFYLNNTLEENTLKMINIEIELNQDF